jgi:hypothetical protein
MKTLAIAFLLLMTSNAIAKAPAKAAAKQTQPPDCHDDYLQSLKRPRDPLSGPTPRADIIRYNVGCISPECNKLTGDTRDRAFIYLSESYSQEKPADLGSIMDGGSSMRECFQSFYDKWFTIKDRPNGKPICEDDYESCGTLRAGIWKAFGEWDMAEAKARNEKSAPPIKMGAGGPASH